MACELDLRQTPSLPPTSDLDRLVPEEGVLHEVQPEIKVLTTPGKDGMVGRFEIGPHQVQH